MGYTIYNKSGETLLISSGSVVKCDEIKAYNTVIQGLPGANKEVIQNMGLRSRRFSVQGEVITAGGSTWLRALPGTTGSITYTDDRGHGFLPSVNLYYISIKFQDRAGRPFERKFTISTVEEL